MSAPWRVGAGVELCSRAPPLHRPRRPLKAPGPSVSEARALRPPSEPARPALHEVLGAQPCEGPAVRCCEMLLSALSQPSKDRSRTSWKGRGGIWPEGCAL